MKKIVILAALLVTAACDSGQASKRDSEIVGAQQSAMSDPPAPSTATFQNAAQEKIDWKSVVDKLSKDNIFRVVYTAQSNAKNRSDDGMSSLSKDDQTRYAQYQADTRAVYAIVTSAKGKDLSSKDKDRVATLQKPYTAARQELYAVLMSRPDLSTDGRTAFTTAIAHSNDTKQMQISTNP